MRRDRALPPGDPVLEAAVIGGCLLDPPLDMRAALLQVLDPSTFNCSLWGACWEQIAASWRAGNEADAMLVSRAAAERVGRDPLQVESEVYAAVAENATSFLTLERARSLRDMATRRQLIDVSQEAARAAYSRSDTAAVLAYVSKLAELVDAADAREEAGDVGPVAADVERRAESGEVLGWQIGLPGYDGWSGGMRGGEVHVIGGASGVGKTWLLGQIANAAVDAGKRVAFVTLEMAPDEIYTRLVCGRLGFIGYRLMGRGRTWSDWERAAYVEARGKLTSGDLRIYADQRSLEQIEAVVRRSEPDLVLVDYLQLLDWPQGITSEYQALTHSCNRLERLAKRAQCTMVLATQVSRAYLAKTGQARGPIQGGQSTSRIDQMADLWVLIQAGEDAGTAVFTCAKNRHGRTGGQFTATLDARRGRFIQ